MCVVWQSTVLQNHPKRQRTGLLNGAATMSAEQPWSGADLACANGMALLSSAAELDAEQAEGSLANEPQPPPQDGHSRRLSSSSDHAQVRLSIWPAVIKASHSPWICQVC